MLKLTLACHEQNPVTHQWERVGDNNYSVELDADRLVFGKNGQFKTIRVECANNGYVYQIRKTKINANGGASGLYDFLRRELDGDTAGGFFPVVCNKVFEYMR